MIDHEIKRASDIILKELNKSDILKNNGIEAKKIKIERKSNFTGVLNIAFSNNDRVVHKDSISIVSEGVNTYYNKEHVNTVLQRVEEVMKGILNSKPEQPKQSKEIEENNPISPNHYKGLPNGLEVIDLTEGLSFCLGNVLKYVFRAGKKTKNPIEDLKKASWYLQREITRLESLNQQED